MFKIDAEGNVSVLSVGPEVAIIRGCCFAQTTVRHIDAVVNIKTKVEVKAELYVCQNCQSSFGGPKRLARHVCAVKSETKLRQFVSNQSSSPILIISDDEVSEDVSERVSNVSESDDVLPSMVIDDDTDDDADNDMPYQDDTDDNELDEFSGSDDDFENSGPASSTLKRNSGMHMRGDIRAYGPKEWLEIQPVQCGNEKIPYDIDGKCIYVIKAASKESLRCLITDGRPWGKDSTTTWGSYDSKLRYWNCGGSLVCPRADCEFRVEDGEVNRLKFGRNKVLLCSFYPGFC